MAVPKPETQKKARLETLDHLRGFFIIGIVVDHLSRYPSIFAILTGKALLWVTAAEGFVGISGLLIGYVRGYKNRDLPLKDVTWKLLRRAGMLYLWSLIASIAYVAIIWYIPLKGGFSSTPMPVGHWREFLTELVLMHYPYVWVHFLTLYAMFLAVSPIAIWLLRRNLAWVVALLSFATLVLGWITKAEPLQWQFLFFIPAIIGYYLQSILDWWKNRTHAFHIGFASATVGLTIVTIAFSVYLNFYGQNVAAMAHYINDVLFAKDSISLLRVAVSFLWFTGYLFIFYAFRRFIAKYLNWLLLPIGTHSLTAYILHGVAICLISYFTIGGENFWVNSLLGAVAIMIVWGLLKIPAVRRVIPA